MRKIYTLLALGLLNATHVAQAQTAALDNLKAVGTSAYGAKANTDIKVTIASIIQALLGFIGIVFFILILWGGVQWMTSGGNEKKLEDAKKRILNASIGLALVLMSYAIASTINKWLSQAVSPSTTGGTGPSGTP